MAAKTFGVTVSIVPIQAQLPLGELHTLDIEGETRRIRRLLSNCDDLCQEIFIGAWDFSCSEHSDGLWESYWQPHLYCVVPTTMKATELKDLIRPLFTSSLNTPLPVKTRQLKHPINVLTYSLKAIFKRRVSYVDSDGIANTRHMSLRLAQERELLLYLDQIGISSRFFFRNVRRRGGKLMVETSNGFGTTHLDSS